MADETFVIPPPDPYQHLAEILWGKYEQPSNFELWQKAKYVELEAFLKPETTVITHIIYDGVVFAPINGRGYIASKNHLILDETDIILSSFPKTGKTWLQEIVYNLVNKEKMDEKSSTSIDIRIPHTEFPECGFEALLNSPSPRILNSQLPYEMLPVDKNSKRKYKIIYITRNPKDTAVSYYFFYKMIASIHYSGSFEEFIDLFLNDSVIYGPFGRHVLSYWNRRNDDNILFLQYENLKKDVKHEIRAIAKFLNIEANDNLVDKIASKCTFEKMSSDPMSNHSQWADGISIANKEELKFMRKGEVGDWKSYFDEETNTRFDEWIEKNFGQSGLQFQYEF